MRIKVTNFNAVKRNTLTGFATVDFAELGFEMQGFGIHQTDTNRWVELPAKSPANPEKKEPWIKVIEFYDRRKEKHLKKEVLMELDVYLNCDEHE